MFSADDYAYMAEALRLAERGLYTTTPNPRVGCVVVKDGRVVGRGWHERAGEPHAEVHALREAGSAARGATAYVTLEPCSHHGRTPPCADALLTANVGRVVAAMEDPNPQVAGRGLARLGEAGVAVQSGLLEFQARELNIGFVARMSRGRPWLRLKVAASLDGRTALANGVSQWITGPAARRDAHALRARSCVVLTGSGTVIADDPSLNVRDVETSRQPLRVVVDGQLRTPASARLLQLGSVTIATASADPSRIAELQAAGAEVLSLPGENGRIDLRALLAELAKRGVNEITVEAGAGLNGALLQADLVDELVVYLAPMVLGDTARGIATLPTLLGMGERKNLEVTDVRMVGGDLRIIARLQN